MITENKEKKMFNWTETPTTPCWVSVVMVQSSPFKGASQLKLTQTYASGHPRGVSNLVSLN